MLVTDRLILRKWRQEDLAPFSSLNADKDVMRYFPAPLNLEQTEGSVQRLSAHIDEHDFGFWATELRETGEFIGFIGMQHVGYDLPFTPAVEIGWRLSKTCWGHGYAPEGARAALAYAFSRLDLNEVVSFSASINEPSQRVMEKIGMTRDVGGDFEHPLVAPGTAIRSHVLYRMKSTDPITF